MKRLWLLAMLLIICVALFNVTYINAATENSQTSDNNLDQTTLLLNTTDSQRNFTIQSSAGDVDNGPTNLAVNKSLNNSKIIQQSSNSSKYNGINNSNSNKTNYQNSKDAAGEDNYQNVRGTLLKAEDVNNLNVYEIKEIGITKSNGKATFNVSQIEDAASKVRAYIENNHMLPNYVQISGYQVNMPQFLEMLTTALLQIKNGNNNRIELKDFIAPTNAKDDINTGYIYQSEFLKIAQDVKNYMDTSSKTPDFAYQTSLGTFLGYQNLVYMYSMILDYHGKSGLIADWAGMKPWYSIAGDSVNSDPSQATFNINQIKKAASRVRKYVENNHMLPNYVQISGYQVNMPQFLEMLTTALLQIKNGNNNPIIMKSFIAPTSPQDNIITGYIYKAEFLKIANDVKNYMDTSSKTPDFAYQTSLGTFLGYQNLVYMYSMILDYHGKSGLIADWAGMKPWSAIAGDDMDSDPSAVTFSVNQIKDAASRVKVYTENNHVLPNYVQISSYQVSMSQFLELLTTALQRINSDNNNLIVLKQFSLPTSPRDEIREGNIPKAEYLKIANDIKNYMDSSGKAPDFAYQTSLGTFLGFDNLVYTYSKILNFIKTENYLPNYVTVKPRNKESETIPSDMQKYIQETANCQVNNYYIKALATSLTNGVSSTYDKGVKIFNWVRDNLNYSFYYDTRYGAVDAYLNREGNCVDHSHLLIAVARAAGIPARYVHGTCTFTSGNVYGHVWAQLYINGRWYDADAISSRNLFGIINNWNKDTVIMNGDYAELPF